MKYSLCADIMFVGVGEKGPVWPDTDGIIAAMKLAKENGLKYAVDIYPRYGSDVGAALHGGHNIKGGLIGPGVHASHGMERTHYSALENSINLILLYLGCKK